MWTVGLTVEMKLRFQIYLNLFVFHNLKVMGNDEMKVYV